MQKNGRNDEIRTHDLFHPKEALYQAELRPEYVVLYRSFHFLSIPLRHLLHESKGSHLHAGLACYLLNRTSRAQECAGLDNRLVLTRRRLRVFGNGKRSRCLYGYRCRRFLAQNGFGITAGNGSCRQIWLCRCSLYLWGYCLRHASMHAGSRLFPQNGGVKDSCKFIPIHAPRLLCICRSLRRR